MKTKLTPLFAAVLGVACGSAQAHMDINVNGFLSAGVATASTDEIAEGIIDEDATFKEDTTLGIQISAPVSDRFSLTGQLVARGTEDYDVDASWAYASFEASDELTLRIGRLRVPFFYYSDFLEVGFAYNWVRPPTEVYRIGFSSVDAIDATYNIELGDIESSFQVYYGRFDDDVNIGGNEIPFELTNFAGAVATFTWNEFSTRLTYHQADIEAPTLGIGTDDPEESWFGGIAFIYDDGDNLAVAEWTTIDHEAVALVDDVAWLAMYARRLNDQFTVHVTYANEDDAQDETGQDALINDQESYIGGVRYDIESNVALKLEVKYNDEKTRNGADGEDGIIYSAAVDMVF